VTAYFVDSSCCHCECSEESALTCVWDCILWQVYWKSTLCQQRYCHTSGHW